MNVRDQQRYDRLRRIVAFLLEHLELKDAVDRAGVIPILQAFIAEIEYLDQGGATARMEGIGLTAQRNALRRVLWDKLDAIGIAADIARVENAAIPPLHPPPFGKRVSHLTADARSIREFALTHRDELLRAGLLASMIDDVARLTQLIDATEVGRLHDSNKRKGHTRTIPTLIRASGQTVKLVRRQFEPLMSTATRLEWDAVISLGRAHRPKALGDGGKAAISDGRRPALPRASVRMIEEGQPVPPHRTRKRGILRRLADFVRPSASAQVTPADLVLEDDVQVEEIKRLPASTETRQTGNSDLNDSALG